ncbi:MAG: AAA family ATPase [Planctomycetales bacterium]|nr:AAA family ATPase [Planctomycetales bacterium]
MADQDQTATAPHVIVLAGPNGSGKTTASRTLLAERLQVATFVNADVIAQGLAGFDPDRAAIQAGKLMLHRLDELARSRETFAFETTLAARSFAPWLEKLKHAGYRVELFYFWLSDPTLNVARVAERVRRGGHHIPEETIRRRYERSVHNLIHLYLPLADQWAIYDNSTRGEMVAVASGQNPGGAVIRNEVVWNRMLELADAPQW